MVLQVPELGCDNKSRVIKINRDLSYRLVAASYLVA